MEDELLQEGLKILNITPATEIVEKFKIYLQELKKWNRAYNLTSLKRDEDIIIKHFFDSLLYLKAIPDGIFSICDIGSGAGFPGVPVAIVRPELTVSLIEPSRKKCAFLRHIKNRLRLQNIEVLEGRVEDIKDKQFDMGITRALFSISELVKKAGHILKKDGFFILSKGPSLERETKELPEWIKIDIIVAPLPYSSIKRNLVKAYIQNPTS